MQENSNNKLYFLLILLSITIVILAAALYSFTVAGTAGTKMLNVTTPAEQKSLSVSGSASVLVVPDTASINLGVLTNAANARDASEKNAASMNTILSALKNLGIVDRDIRTSYLSIQPIYSYPKDGGAPTITGYSASNNVEVTTNKPEKLSDIIDKSVAAGANQVSSISFLVSEEKQKQIREDLLINAVRNAQEKASKLAESLKVRIVGVRTSTISETGFPEPVPLAPGIMEKAATPIQPGESRVTLSVQVTYIIE